MNAGSGDIEDFAEKPSPIQINLPIEKMKISSDKKKEDDPFSQYKQIKDCPPPDENFTEWLRYQKQHWKSLRFQMRKDNQVIRSVKPSAIQQFIRNMDEVVLNSYWHIMHIAETLDPGILKVWAMTDTGQMFNVKMKVPRTIYINSKTVSEDP